MRIKIVVTLIFLITICIAGISCGSSKANKITGSVRAGNPRNEGNVLYIKSDKSRISVGDTATITTKISNTDGSVLSGYGTAGVEGTAATISVVYSINTFGTLSSSSESATLAGSTTTDGPKTTGAYYFYITLTGVKTGTAEITATHLDMQMTIYVDIE